jgi:hypothetical protein
MGELLVKNVIGITKRLQVKIEIEGEIVSLSHSFSLL